MPNTPKQPAAPSPPPAGKTPPVLVSTEGKTREQVKAELKDKMRKAGMLKE